MDAMGWIGAELPRREDRRHLLGQGVFAADIPAHDALHLAFLRSPLAHGRLSGLRRPPGGCVFTAEDLGPLPLLPAGPDMPGFRQAPYPPLADGHVRFVGQPIAACAAPTLAAAEDLLAACEALIDPLPALPDVAAALAPGARPLHSGWTDNRYATGRVRGGDLGALAAPLRIRRRLSLGRQSASPLEPRAMLAVPDRRTGELVLHVSSQGPHTLRHALAAMLGIPEARLRVVAPDVGGGFGAKNRLMPEEAVVAALALRLDRPVRWVETRTEHLLAGAQAREHHYDLTLHATGDGIALGIEGEIWIDAGAYALWPTGAFAEAGMAARNLCGPYRIAHLDVTHHTVATTKPPMGPYRGVGRTGACFAIERLLDALADETGIPRAEIRRRNLLRAEELPHATPSGLSLDTGDYRAALDAALAMPDQADIAARRARGQRIGVGVALYTEQSGHGTAEWAQRKNRVVPGHEAATLRMHPDGSLTLLVAIQSHGQGLETSLAQIVAHELGVHPDGIEVRHGDTALSPFGFGTFASRSLVFAGGAAERAAQELRGKLARIAAHLLQADAASIRFRDGCAFAGPASVPLADIAHAALLRQERLPPGEPPGLEAHVTYSPPEEGGVFSYAAHVAVLRVDEETGGIELLDYCVAEDCGTMINPMIVDGQVHGGVVQGIGTALMEEVRFDADGQPQAATFLDYRLPEAGALPPIRVRHLVTPARATVHGAKGVGEGGAIAPPAAILSALEDALPHLRLRLDSTPVTASRLHAAIRAALR
jgi:carbon-monoxide dehydrogenase large subunit